MKTKNTPSKKEQKVEEYVNSLGVNATVDKIKKDAAWLSLSSVSSAYKALLKHGLKPRKVNEDKCTFKVPHGKIVLRLAKKQMILRNAN